MVSKATGKAGPLRANGNALHVSILLEECMNLLGPALTAEAPVMIDVTLGMGGYSFTFLERFASLTVVGIDRDPGAVELTGGRLVRFGKRFIAVHATYDGVSDVVVEYGRTGWADAVLIDLGISSLQLDDEGRGFSCFGDGPLDMRIDRTGGPTTVDVLAPTDRAELARILREYGEERFASCIATRILAAHATEPIERTGQLADIVRDAILAPARHTGGNPCKRIFQALRIAVNNEFALLRRAILRTIEAITVGGRIAAELHQSLKDKTVKCEMARGAAFSTSVGLSVELDDRVPYLRLLTRGTVETNAAEPQANPRSASIRLRAAERLRETPYTV